MNMMQSNMINASLALKELDAVKASQIGLMAPSLKKQGGKPTVNVSHAQTAPAMLLELVTIVTQIAQLDAMFAQVKKGAPHAGSEADKWHQVSVQALECSRKYMVEQQMSLLQRLAIPGTPIPSQNDKGVVENQNEDAKVEKAVISPPPGLEMPFHHEDQPSPPQ